MLTTKKYILLDSKHHLASNLQPKQIETSNHCRKNHLAPILHSQSNLKLQTIATSAIS